MKVLRIDHLFLAVVPSILLAVSGCSSDNQPVMPSGSPLDEARALAREGRFEKALEKHLWIHNHILKENPAYYGVRLSFALSEWVELGKKYPKALSVLIDLRDRKAERLLSSEHDRELFHDVQSINQYLGQAAYTVDLFKRLEASSPEFASQLYDLAEESLVGAGEYTLARKYLGDPMPRLESARLSLQDGLKYAATSRIGDASRRAHQNIFAEDMVRMISILKNTGELPLAKRVQSEALLTLDTPRIREALSPTP